MFSFFFLPSFLPFFSIFSLSFIVLFLLTPTSPSQDSALNVGYTTHILTFNRQWSCVAVLSCFLVGPINKINALLLGVCLTKVSTVFEPPCVNCIFRQNHQEGLVPQLMPRTQKTNKLVSTGRKFHTSKMLTRN